MTTTKKTITEEYDGNGKLIKRTEFTEITHNDYYPIITTGINTNGFDVSKCPCNPALGGSGICGCVLGGPMVTC